MQEQPPTPPEEEQPTPTPLGQPPAVVLADVLRTLYVCSQRAPMPAAAHAQCTEAYNIGMKAVADLPTED